MTNETVVAYTYIGFPNVFADSAKVDRDTSVSTTLACSATEYPRFRRLAETAAAGGALVFNPGGFEAAASPLGFTPTSTCPA